MKYHHSDILSGCAFLIAHRQYVVLKTTSEEYVVYKDVTAINSNDGGIALTGELVKTGTKEYDTAVSCAVVGNVKAIPPNKKATRTVGIIHGDAPINYRGEDVLLALNMLSIIQRPFGPRQCAHVFFREQKLYNKTRDLLCLRTPLPIEDRRIGATFDDQWKIIPGFVLRGKYYGIQTPYFYEAINHEELIEYLCKNLGISLYPTDHKAEIRQFHKT